MASSDSPHKQSSPRNSLSPENMEMMNTYMRFLVSNAEAGSVIGKGGATINDFQSQSGARIQLSRNYEFFPGTSDRIITVSGTIDDILKAVDLILSKLLNEFYVEDEDDVDPRSEVRVVVPNSCCGGIIGRGGATIKSFIEDSQAGIKISPQDNNYLGLSYRLVLLNGTLKEQIRAIDLILTKLADDPHYAKSMNVPFPYAAAYNATNYGPNAAGGKFQSNRPQNKDERNSSLTIGVADEHIGIVLGRGGKNILEISQTSGARIKISEKGDFISGTSDRKVTITGSEKAICVAEALISHKIASASASASVSLGEEEVDVLAGNEVGS